MKPDRRIMVPMILLLVVLAGLVVYEYGYLRLQADIAATRDAESTKIKTLGKYAAFVARKPQLQAKLAELKDTRKAEDAKLIEGQTPTVAASSLQSAVKTLVTGRGGTISSERVEKPEELGKFTVIAVSIDTIIPDARALTEVLYAIETQTPYLVVGEVDARIKDLREPRELMTRLKVLAITVAK